MKEYTNVNSVSISEGDEVEEVVMEMPMMQETPVEVEETPKPEEDIKNSQHSDTKGKDFEEIEAKNIEDKDIINVDIDGEVEVEEGQIMEVETNDQDSKDAKDGKKTENSNENILEKPANTNTNNNTNTNPNATEDNLNGNSNTEMVTGSENIANEPKETNETEGVEQTNNANNAKNDDKNNQENNQENPTDKEKETPPPKIFIKQLDITDFVAESQPVVLYYKCPLCDGVYYHPMVDSCGHVFCKTCLLKQIDISPKCPFTGNDLTDYNKIDIISNILNNQRVYCRNRKLNCDWMSKLSDLESHLEKECPKQTIQCKYKKCTHPISREEFDEHLKACDYRVVNCEFCTTEIPHTDIKSHQDECPLFKVKCPQLCGIEIIRKDLDEHKVTDCLNTVTVCPFKDIGCDSVITKKSMDEYLKMNTNKHNIQMISFMKSFMTDVKSQLASLEDCKKMMQLIDKRLPEFNSGGNNGNNSSVGKKRAREDNNTVNIESNTKNKHARNGNTISNEVNLDSGSVNEEEFLLGLETEPVVIAMSHDSQEELHKKKSVAKDNNSNKDNGHSHRENNHSTHGNHVNNNNHSTHPNKPKDKAPGISPSSYFDMNNISKGLTINKKRVTCTSNKAEHKYCFADFPITSDFEFKTTFFLNSPWAAAGVCVKEQVIANKLKFVSQTKSNYHNATFAISTNGYLWNCNNPTEFNISLNNFPIVEKGDSIVFKYSPDFKELSFKLSGKGHTTNSKTLGKLTNVHVPKNYTLVPCMILLNNGDEAIFELL